MLTDDEAIDKLSRLLNAQDYPLWRVACRVSPSYVLIFYLLHLLQLGLEEEAVFYLFQRADEMLHLRSAFTCGSI